MSNRRKNLTTADYLAGIKSRDRTILGRAITLIESNAANHLDQAQELLTEIMPLTGNSIRIGITGVPGAGKSTFTETFGLYLIEQGQRVAVLAVDPSSSLTGGSILGDKTRMEHLARHPESFIRPSPSGGALGGVARKTRESMLICEAAGYDVIIVETVGVGQSEVTVRSMVDFFLLMQIAGSGDELQGIKRGIMELADALVVNKADGENLAKAESARKEFASAMHYMTPVTQGWQPKTLTCSALTGKGIAELWEMVSEFRQLTQKNGVFAERRSRQARDWMHTIVDEYLREMFLKHHAVNKLVGDFEAKVMAGKMPATTAARTLLKVFENENRAKGK